MADAAAVGRPLPGTHQPLPPLAVTNSQLGVLFQVSLDFDVRFNSALLLPLWDIVRAHSHLLRAAAPCMSNDPPGPPPAASWRIGCY